jgi:Zn-dependent oligopeptidase
VKARARRPSPHTAHTARAMQFRVLSRFLTKQFSTHHAKMQNSSSLPRDLLFNLSPLAIEACTDKLVHEITDTHNTIAKLPLNEVSWNNTMKALYLVDDRLAGLNGSVTFPMHTSTDAKVRDASTAANGRLDKLGVELSGRKDVYQRLKQLPEPKEKLEARLLKETLSDYERQGVLLEGEAFDKLQKIRTRLSQISVEFQSNMNEDNTKLLFEASALEGLTKEFIASLPRVGDKVQLTLKYTGVCACRLL